MSIKLSFENVSAKNFEDLKGLVIEQAMHHGCKYRGSDSAFIDALEMDHPVANVIMARDADNHDPLGYILYNHFFGIKGQELYIEDILVSEKRRGGGVGYHLSENLKGKARDKGIDKISWVVARDNDVALQFYRERMRAKPLSYDGFDCSQYFSSLGNVGECLKVIEAIPCDIDRVEDLLLRAGISDAKICGIRDAVIARHSKVFLSQDSKGCLLSLAVVNSNFSSFRTVFGYKAEIMEVGNDKERVCLSFDALLREISEISRVSNHSGHLYLFVDRNSVFQMEYVRRVNHTPLMMSDAPNSFLEPYAIGREIIFGNGV